MQAPSLHRQTPSVRSAPAPRVLQLLPDRMPGAYLQQIVALGRHLDARGGGMTTAGGNAHTIAALNRAKVLHRTADLGAAGLFQSSRTQALLEHAGRDGTQLIHLHGTAAAPAARAIADATGLPLVMSCPTLPQAGGILGKRSVRRALVGRPVIVNTAYAALCLGRDFGLSRGEITVVTPGIDTDYFDPAHVSEQRTISLADRWGLLDDPREVILVTHAASDPGRLNWLLECASGVGAPDAVWILIGNTDDPATDDTVSFALDRSGLGGRVRWYRHCPDMLAAYKLASVVVSLAESRTATHLHALQAQAMGRPVIVPDSGSGPEALLPGKTGWLIRRNDAGSLSYAISAATGRDAVVREATSAAAREFIATSFAMTAYQTGILSAYDRALGH